MLYEPKILVANVRGLNDRARRTSVRSVVGSTGASIVCLQETKLSAVTPTIVMEALGADFDAYFCLPASDTRGGVIVASMSRVVQLDSAHIGANSITARVAPFGGEPWWWLTCVYGPQAEADKIAFLDELRDTRRTHQGPWALCGDF
jgi:exonuclease III